MSKTFDSQLPFSDLAHKALGDSQLRSNLAHATSTIRRKRQLVTAELDNWEALRNHGASVKAYALDHLDELAQQFEEAVKSRGGIVHWARDAEEANAIAISIIKETGATSAIKVKSMVSAEIELNNALSQAGIAAFETDLAELIVQLGDDLPSHILVPAIHKNRAQIRDIFISHMGDSGLPAPPNLTDAPKDLAAAARTHLRGRFFDSIVGICGANFAIAESGSLVIVESEGNGRMCLTLPKTLIALVGIEKLIPKWTDLGVFLELLPRSSTGERMNPYTSIFSGVHAGDGPESFHVILLDNGRTNALRDHIGRDALRCIRCSACLNVCPVYERTGGHAYGSPYPGPIGAILVPQLRRGRRGPLENSLPFASSLCGACYEVCPVKIDIPKLLVHLRSEIIDDRRSTHPLHPEAVAMGALERLYHHPKLFAKAVALGALAGRLTGQSTIKALPPPLNAWTRTRDLPMPQQDRFRDHNATASSQTSSKKGTWREDWRWIVGLIRQGLRTPQQGSRPRAADKESCQNSARAQVLESIRQANRDAHVQGDAVLPTRDDSPEVPIEDLGARIDLFHERLVDYRARVTRTDVARLSATLNEILASSKTATVVIPSDLPAPWNEGLAPKVSIDDTTLGVSDLNSTDCVITGCAFGVAETGTIVLDASSTQGRRVLSLIPDHHIVVIKTSQIVLSVQEAVDRLDPTRPQTWISGPSATSDIELERVEGVHGPRTLDVVILSE